MSPPSGAARSPPRSLPGRRIDHRLRTALAFILLLAPCHAEPVEAPAGEIYRIRIENRKSGLVQVSLDAGRTYWTVGRVVHPANARITGFAAASYTPRGTVAAVAVHGIRIKTGQSALGLGKAQMPLMFSVAPQQFAVIPSGYGGHIPRSSAVITDIPAGHSIFRNESAYVGSPVFVERSRRLEPLPEDYLPRQGEVFVIEVTRPGDMPSAIEFENRGGGKVTARYPNGSSRVIAKVMRAVWGVGRYDGTTFTGVGAVNTNHGGVLTISTAPAMPSDTKEGGAVETRGGFMIQPYFHVCEQNETSPQVMVIGSLDTRSPHLEGTPPLFGGCINLSWYPGSPANSYRAQARIDDGEWEDVPEIVGKADDALRPSYLGRYFTRIGKPREVTTGVTAIRLLFPVYDPKLVARDLARDSGDYTRKATANGAQPLTGEIALAPSVEPRAKCLVNFYIDGAPVYTSNKPPYEFKWDSRAFPNGFHAIEIESARESGGSPAVERREVLVGN